MDDLHDYNFNDKASSLVVRPGCQLDAWKHDHEGGTLWHYKGKHPYLDENDTFSSLHCYCEYSDESLTCTPTEEYVTINTCTNSNEGTDMTCSHTTERGLSLGRDVTQGKSMSVEASSFLQLEFEEVFSVGLSASMTTTYDWSVVNSIDYSEVISESVSCTVPYGDTIQIKQVWGRCGETTVKTGEYKCE